LFAYADMFIRVFCALFGLRGLFIFPKRSHVWVPISLSPLVAFAPAGDREMGTEERSVDPEQRTKRFGTKKEVVFGNKQRSGFGTKKEVVDP
jgi:hypothetical protein